jgi:site-specific recombinase XerD
MTPRNPDEPNERLPAIIPRESGAPLASLNPLAALTRRYLLWFRLVKQRSENTILAYTRDLASFLEFCEKAGITTPGAISFRELEVFMAWRQHEHGASASTVNRNLYALRSFFRWCLREGVVQANPADLVDTLKTTRSLPVYLTVEEQERVLTALAKDATLLGRRNYALIATALLTGLRVSELCNLRPEHVNLETGTLRVVRGKGGKDRELPIVPRLKAILAYYAEHVRPALLARPFGTLYRERSRGRLTWYARWWIDGRKAWKSTGTQDRAEAERWLAARVPLPVSPYFFVNAALRNSGRLRREGLPLLTSSVYAIVHDHVSLVAGKPLHPHALRHSFGFRIRENDGPIELLQEALGHASIQTTMIYAHLSSRKRRTDLERYLTAAG